ncbi:hypothetical protein BJ508DRAFT_418150 [Ascobolus immersus RN42]|uniref:TPR-like protein n=1 Tax=Ascobolus immersus RN42 TaxID=1160509 RepID=A0A3N4HQ19_ASCIM|nr:hypothetical protein BJ508DRAFT_418150 [Ascobolus immersus RN42]
MAKTKSQKKKDRRSASATTKTGTTVSNNPFVKPTASPSTSAPTQDITAALAEATTLLATSPTTALAKLHDILTTNPTSLPALELAAEISVETGDLPTARSLFLRSVELDPTGLPESSGGSGPEKFLFLAQLSEHGGLEAVSWYERGLEALRRLNVEYENKPVKTAEDHKRGREVKRKIISALCALVEIYMTDLCMSPDAESRCERYVSEALLISPDGSSAEALQTLASIRISQERLDDAKVALSRAYDVWKDIDVSCATEEETERIPEYGARVVFAKLLIEMEMLEDAVDVLERLQNEDDAVVDVWYLGGWCLFLLGEKQGEKEKAGVKLGEEEETKRELWESAREWLGHCKNLYMQLDWDDEGIKQHTIELLQAITAELGEATESKNDEEDDDEEEGDWDDFSDDEDEEMGGQ